MIVMLKILAILAVLIVLAVLGFIFALVNASKRATKAQQSLEEHIRQIISTARRIRFKAESDIKRLSMWAVDAINLTYGSYISNIPAQQLLEQFDQIKQQFADKVDPAQAEKTERIVKNYIGQIQIKKAEMESALKTEQKYQQLLDQLKQAKISQRKMAKLDRHQQRIEQMNQNIDTQKKLIEQNLSYDMIKQDVEQKLAYLEALHQLQEQYDTQSFVQNAEVYKQEMDKIISNLN